MTAKRVYNYINVGVNGEFRKIKSNISIFFKDVGLLVYMLPCSDCPHGMWGTCIGNICFDVSHFRFDYNRISSKLVDIRY